MAFVAEHSEKKDLNKNWRSEFDQDGMVRSMRVPLGHASKTFRKKGSIDVHGHVLT